MRKSKPSIILGLAFALLAGTPGPAHAAGQNRGAAPNKPRPQNQAAPANQGAESIELFLHDLSEAAARKDLTALHSMFAKNFAGPFRIPKAARSVLDRIVPFAQTITLEFEPMDIFAAGDRGVCLTQAALTLVFPGGQEKTADQAYMLQMDRAGQQWKITDAAQLDQSWEVDPKKARVVWKDLGVSFPRPAAWLPAPVRRPDTVRALVMVSPDLLTTVSVAVVESPVLFSAKRIAILAKTVEHLFPGSKFLKPTTIQVGGRPAPAFILDLDSGPRIFHTLNAAVPHGETTVFVTEAAAHPRTLAQVEAPFRKLCNGLKLFPAPPAKGSPDLGTIEHNRYVNRKYGFSCALPRGWKVSVLSRRFLKRQNWQFAVRVTPDADSNVFAIIGSRKMPANLSRAMLKRIMLEMYRQLSDDVKILEDKTVAVNGRQGLLLATRLDLGILQYHRDLLIPGDGRLYFISAEATPASAWEKAAPALEPVFHGIQLLQKSQPPANQP